MILLLGWYSIRQSEFIKLCKPRVYTEILDFLVFYDGKLPLEKISTTDFFFITNSSIRRGFNVDDTIDE